MTVAAVTAGCGGWHGLNSLPLPGTQGQGPGSYVVQVQLPNVVNIQPNSRVRVSDVNVGTVTKVERQDWHALVTMRLNSDVVLPANTTAKIGQTSLLGTMHIELAPPTDEAPEGHLHQGSLIPLSHAGAYPTTEQTLSVASTFLNGGGLAKAQDITQAFSTAFAGREADLRSLIQRIDEFSAHVQDQIGDIIAANESFNNVTTQFAQQKPLMDNALRTIPDALAVLSDNRNKLVEAFDQIGKFSALAADTADKTKDALAKEFRALGPVFDALANAGPALTRSLSLLATYPWPKETMTKYFRGDAANITMVIDMTLSRLDTSFFTGTRWEGNLTELEMQWGRTIGQLPSPVTGGNPLVVPYHLDQRP
ncbi:MCE family protein [Mycolicibacterium sp. lyk4-40-TYG-92]|uniref:MCE family protein n=1 Tax=Mycolicibacterium sp. lyk4-40-TYG-92 TaxID=3040295 RepID=UPI00254D5F5F|nr:MCE family protein [Mycolicibacterium sp. lyk4-40-TYG-92]